MLVLSDHAVLGRLATTGQLPVLPWVPEYQTSDGCFRHTFQCPHPACSHGITVLSPPNTFLDLCSVSSHAARFLLTPPSRANLMID